MKPSACVPGRNDFALLVGSMLRWFRRCSGGGCWVVWRIPRASCCIPDGTAAGSRHRRARFFAAPRAEPEPARIAGMNRPNRPSPHPGRLRSPSHGCSPRSARTIAPAGQAYAPDPHRCPDTEHPGNSGTSPPHGVSRCPSSSSESRITRSTAIWLVTRTSTHHTRGAAVSRSMVSTVAACLHSGRVDRIRNDKPPCETRVGHHATAVGDHYIGNQKVIEFPADERMA